MTVKASSKQFDQAQEDGEELVLVAVTYDGDRSVYQNRAMQNQGYWPSFASFTQGSTQVAVLPDQGLGWWERHSDFDVDYSKEGIAEAFLDKNYLAPEVFGAKISKDVQSFVLDKLEMNAVPRTAEAIREELADIAGVEDPGREASTMEGLEADLNDETRSTLQRTVSEIEDRDIAEFDESIANAGKTDLIDFLVELDEIDVTAALNEVQERDD